MIVSTDQGLLPIMVCQRIYFKLNLFNCSSKKYLIVPQNQFNILVSLLPWVSVWNS
jgi:hypothetical protein